MGDICQINNALCFKTFKVNLGKKHPSAQAQKKSDIPFLCLALDSPGPSDPTKCPGLAK